MTISTKINNNQQAKQYGNININPNKSLPHYWNKRSKNNHSTAFQELLGRLEKFLISNKDMVTKIKPIQKEDIDVCTQVLKDIDYQLNIIKTVQADINSWSKHLFCSLSLSMPHLEHLLLFTPSVTPTFMAIMNNLPFRPTATEKVIIWDE